MTKRSHDFHPAKIDSIKRLYGFVCAACGSQDSRGLQADHWISGDAEDDGVCLCHFCNVNIKGKKFIPRLFSLPPRAAVPMGLDYLDQVYANQDAFAAWIRTFWNVKRDPNKKYKHLVTPH